MMKYLLALLALSTALAVSPAASAQKFDFTFTYNSSVVASGAQKAVATVTPGKIEFTNSSLFHGGSTSISNGRLVVSKGVDFNIFSRAPGAKTDQIYGNSGFNVHRSFNPDAFHIPEYSGLSTLLLSLLTLAGGFAFKARQSGLFLTA